MRISLGTLSIGLLILAVGARTWGQAGGNASPLTTAPAAAPAKLAAVDVVKLFDALTEKIEADEEIDTMKRDLQADVRQAQGKVDKLQRDIKDLAGTTAELKQAEDNLKEATTAVKNLTASVEPRLNQEMRTRTAALYKKINAAVGAYAEANSIAFVFVADNSNVDATTTVQQLQAVVATRKLLYNQPAYDITRAITQKMNTDFELSKKPKNLP